MRNGTGAELIMAEWWELSEMLKTGIELLYNAAQVRRWRINRFLRGTLNDAGVPVSMSWRAVSRMRLQILSKQLISTSAIVVTYHRIACIIQYLLRLGGWISPPSSCSHPLPSLRFWHSSPLIGDWQSSSVLQVMYMTCPIWSNQY